MGRLTLAIPSKGRLMEQTTDMFARVGLVVRKIGYARGYRGEAWEPAPLLVELADAGLSFHQYAARPRAAA